MTFLKKLFLILVKGPSKIGEGKEDPFKKLSDEALVAKIVSNNNTMLFGILYDRFVQRVYNKCLGFSKTEAEAEDLTQDVFLLLFVKLKTFKGNSKFSTWVYSLTYNFCANYVSRDKQKKISDQSDSVEDTYYQFTEEVSDASLFELRSDKLEQALKIIDPEDRSILLLKYQDGVSIKELTTLLDISESAVKMRLKRSKGRVVQIYNTLS